MTDSKCHEPLIVVDLFGVLQVISALSCVRVVARIASYLHCVHPSLHMYRHGSLF